MSSSAARRALAVTAGAAALTLGLAVPALAHVTINPGSAEQGGFTKVAFRVPNERDDASTSKIEVAFPTDHPLAFVSVKPVPGWKVEVTEGELPKPVTTEYGELTEAVTKVTWSGGKIEPGQFQEFEVSMGRLPADTDRLVFPATQTYSSGEVVAWDDEPKADGSEPEHPAPVLRLTPAAAGSDGHGGHPASPAAAASPGVHAAPSVAPVTVAAGSSDGTARLLGGAGLAAGLAGLAAGLLGLRRGSRTAPAADPDAKHP
ncbi:YcnI family copper-binding membrane protein [Planomonospora parontospora]|uniref:YcnI family copper-binding membrane protein n=1 Tax=Planomonospora parontospora TaxID=58119 RepID=UPI001670FE9D|nr:YcnI family protein [Planomonospora parontospora]GGL53962.1 membrane protein [Planomonospora parontospora subsp. antibiotica]GII19657.1 membrane protein [Planomonospora parontospora subsp. antibiotica]